MSKPRLSGFAQFPNNDKRNQFVSAVSLAEPALISHAYFPVNRPTILFEGLTRRERKRVVLALQGLGQWVEDVQFETNVSPGLPSHGGG